MRQPRIVNSHDGAVELLRRAADGRFDAAVFEWIRDGAKHYLQARGSLDFGTCVGLPSAPSKFLNAYRNLRLREVATMADRQMQMAGRRRGVPEEVADLMAQFIARGPWQQWSARAAPPVWATPLQEALFYAVRFNGGRGLTARRVRDLLGSK